MVGLLSLILTLSFSLAVRFMRVAQGEALRNEIHQQLLIALSRIGTSASKTIPSGVSLSQTSPIAVAFNPYRVDGNGQKW